MLINLAFENFVLLAMRLVIATVFFVHGISKLRNWKGLPPFMRFIGIAETFGSISMLGGFLVQISAIGLGIIILGAIYKKVFVWKVPFNTEKGMGWEFDLTILVILLALIIFGAGTFSIDSMIGFLILL